MAKKARTEVGMDVQPTLKKVVAAKNEEQKNLLRAIGKNTITFVKGAPGTGKTYLSVVYGLQMLFKGRFKQIVFTRPVVEAAGEKLGFLPGNLDEKVAPYMMPLFEALRDLVTEQQFRELTTPRSGFEPIRVVPLAYMRGMTFNNAFIICDEMQNANPSQIRMLTTRIGENSKMVISGDVLQSDIVGVNGLQDAFGLLQGVDGIGFVTLTCDAIVRHPIIASIERRYNHRNEAKAAAAEPATESEGPVIYFETIKPERPVDEDAVTRSYEDRAD